MKYHIARKPNGSYYLFTSYRTIGAVVFFKNVRPSRSANMHNAMKLYKRYRNQHDVCLPVPARSIPLKIYKKLIGLGPLAQQAVLAKAGIPL